MNRERRLARPFAGISKALTEALNEAVLHFGNGRIKAGARLHWQDSDSYPAQTVLLEWCPSGNFEDFQAELRLGCRESELSPDALALVVTATSKYLGFVDELVRHSLDKLDALQSVLDLRVESPDAAAWQTSIRGCRIDAYLLLARQIEEKRLRPWRKGVWLSRATFTIKADHTAALYELKRLDGVARDRFELSARVVRYINLPDRIWEDDAMEQIPELYLDADILDRIDARPNAMESQVAQAELVNLFLRSVLTDAHINRDEWRSYEWKEIETSILGRVLRSISGTEASDRECTRWKNELSDGNLEKVLSECEGVTNFRALLRRAFVSKG